MNTTKKVGEVALALCGLAVSLNAQNLYVGNWDSGIIGEYGLDGSTINASLVTGWTDPAGIAFSGNALFVLNSLAPESGGEGAIGEYTTSGATVDASLFSDLDGPDGIAISGTNMYIAFWASGTVGQYTTSGATVNASLISGLDSPEGIAISGTNLFVVADQETGVIGEYTTSGAVVNSSLITGLNDPTDIAISGTNLFVSNYNGGTVGEYTTSGQAINASLITGLSSPWGIAIWGTNLYVANRNGETIGEYTSSGQIINASLITGLQGPAALAITAPSPSLDGISLSGTNLILTGANGSSGLSYYLLATTNLLLPISQWTPIATNTWSTNGNFTLTVTNAINRSTPQCFYLLVATSPTPPPQPPQVTAESFSEVSATSATLTGSILPNGADTTWVFQWWNANASTIKTNATSPQIVSGTNVSPVAVQAKITGLNQLTVYTFQLLATNFAGSAAGAVETFQTPR